jgi:hypothetical protein
LILLYPIVLGSAVVIWGRRAGVTPGGWPWFAAWTCAGALMTFSFLTGFSIGLFLLPVAGGTLLAVAWRAPGAPDAVGFFEGVGLMLLLVPLVNPDAGPTLLFAGLVIGLGAIAAYSAALVKRARSGS